MGGLLDAEGEGKPPIIYILMYKRFFEKLLYEKTT